MVNDHYYDWSKHKHGLLDGSRKRKKVFLVLVLAVTFYQVVTFSYMEEVWALTVQSQITHRCNPFESNVAGQNGPLLPTQF